MTIHKSVLLEEAIESLNLKAGDVVVDGTLGGGGHSLAILRKIAPEGKLIAIDRDPTAIEKFKKEIEDSDINIEMGNVFLANDNFSNLEKILSELGIESVDGVLADFGFSSDQIEDPERGFSFQRESVLDMRMDQRQKKTAEIIVNEYEEDALEKIIRELGEEKFSQSIVHAIVQKRSEKKIESTSDLVKIIEGAVPDFYKRKRIHFATKTFQAIRMEVNNELESIRKFIPQAIVSLKKGGRVAVISFHSGEDRIAKEVLRTNAGGCICPPEFPICQCGIEPKVKIINKRAIVASAEEQEENPRSRSAKMRVAEKI